jgi:SAM-dependent methyltransferase
MKKRAIDVGSWPADGLERVGNCLSCGSSDSVRLYDGLRDQIFQCAADGWAFQKCQRCASVFLDPRPTPEAISLAYQNYYTHGPADCDDRQTSAAGLRQRIIDGYLNARYGTKYPGAIPAGQLIALAFPFRRAAHDAGLCRHLPRARRGMSRVLDVGCGNGKFLQFAVDAGWTATGVDSDPVAVNFARGRGLDVRHADVCALPFPSGSFDYITASHVLEHVHRPMELLLECRRTLMPSGQLWLETPNIGSLGHAVFGSAWRGLEPPRHLAIYSRSALLRMLRDAGFESARFRFHGLATKSIWKASRQLMATCMGGHLETTARGIGASLIGRFMAEYCEALFPASREFLTCIATAGKAS